MPEDLVAVLYVDVGQVGAEQPRVVPLQRLTERQRAGLVGDVGLQPAEQRRQGVAGGLLRLGLVDAEFGGDLAHR